MTGWSKSRPVMWVMWYSFVMTLPLYYLANGRPRAVLGYGNSQARKFIKSDELTFTLSYAIFEVFLARWQESFLGTGT